VISLMLRMAHFGHILREIKGFWGNRRLGELLSQVSQDIRMSCGEQRNQTRISANLPMRPHSIVSQFSLFFPPRLASFRRARNAPRDSNLHHKSSPAWVTVSSFLLPASNMNGQYVFIYHFSSIHQLRPHWFSPSARSPLPLPLIYWFPLTQSYH
jgi:hypothetical protein